MTIDFAQYDGSNLEHDSLTDNEGGEKKVVKRAPNKAILKPKGAKTRWPWGDDWNHEDNPHIWESESDDNN